ncbi:hypothetical protein BV22DRAFT_998106, partial [Leucogyrophana mollusca]
FPPCEMSRPGPVVTPHGEQEWMVERIIDKWRRGRGHQYLVWWSGYGAEADEWLPQCEL